MMREIDRAQRGLVPSRCQIPDADALLPQKMIGDRRHAPALPENRYTSRRLWGRPFHKGRRKVEDRPDVKVRDSLAVWSHQDRLTARDCLDELRLKLSTIGASLGEAA